MSTDRRSIIVNEAPPAIGPYVHAVAAGGLLFCSGQIPLDAATGELVGTTAAEQAEQCLKNLTVVAEGSGASLAAAVRCTVYLTDMADFVAVNEVYARFFAVDPPARVAFAVSALPMGSLVEIDAVIALQND